MNGHEALCGSVLPYAVAVLIGEDRRNRQRGVDEREKWTCRSRSAAVRRVRLEKLNHTEAVEPRRDALIADELEC